MPEAKPEKKHTPLVIGGIYRRGGAHGAVEWGTCVALMESRTGSAARRGQMARAGYPLERVDEGSEGLDIWTLEHDPLGQVATRGPEKIVPEIRQLPQTKPPKAETAKPAAAAPPPVAQPEPRKPGRPQKANKPPKRVAVPAGAAAE